MNIEQTSKDISKSLEKLSYELNVAYKRYKRKQKHQEIYEACAEYLNKQPKS